MSSKKESRRFSLLGTHITVLLLFVVLSFVAALITLLVIIAPILGEHRLEREIPVITARFLPAAAIAAAVFSVLGVVWLSVRMRINIYNHLARLKTAASQIRNGHYNYELPIGNQGIFHDVSLAFEAMRLHLKATTQAAEKSERERRYLMANITHDLRTPVTSILGYAEGILDGVAASPERQRQYAEIIRDKALALKALVDDLGLLSVLEDAPPLELERLDVGSWLHSFAEEQSYQLETPPICQCETELFCAVDRIKLERVMSNLVGNARKYAHPPGGEPLLLTFRAETDGEFALLILTDNGGGLPPEEMRRVFDRFYRADPSRGQVGGHGLGLSIARQIVTLHKGKIWLTNRPEGGLCATVALPLMG